MEYVKQAQGIGEWVKLSDHEWGVWNGPTRTVPKL
jgi:hypothetical protein